MEEWEEEEEEEEAGCCGRESRKGFREERREEKAWAVVVVVAVEGGYNPVLDEVEEEDEVRREGEAGVVTLALHIGQDRLLEERNH